MSPQKLITQLMILLLDMSSISSRENGKLMRKLLFDEIRSCSRIKKICFFVALDTVRILLDTLEDSFQLVSSEVEI